MAIESRKFLYLFAPLCLGLLINCAPQLEGEGSDQDAGISDTGTPGDATTADDAATDPDAGTADDAATDPDAGPETPCDGVDDGSNNNCPNGMYACNGGCFPEDTDLPCNGVDDGSNDNCPDEGWYACEGGCWPDPNAPNDCNGVDDGSYDCPDGWYACNGGCWADGSTPDAGTPDTGTTPDAATPDTSTPDTGGCPTSCGDSDVYVYVEAGGGLPADYMCLNMEVTNGDDPEDFGAWSENVATGHDVSFLEYEANVAAPRCVRFNTVVLNNGSESWLCYGYGASARLTADAEVRISGQLVPVQIVSVAWKIDGQDVFGCSAVACLNGDPPDYLDFR